MQGNAKMCRYDQKCESSRSDKANVPWIEVMTKQKVTSVDKMQMMSATL